MNVPSICATSDGWHIHRASAGSRALARYDTTMVKWVVPFAVPSCPSIVTLNVPGAVGVPVIWPFVEFAIAWMDRPGGRFCLGEVQ